MLNVDCLCTMYSFTEDHDSRSKHWGVDFHIRHSLKKWGGLALLRYKSDDEALHRGGRMKRYCSSLRKNGVRRILNYQEIENIITEFDLKGWWSLAIPDQFIGLDTTIETIWYFSDEDEGFLFALGVSPLCGLE